MNDTSDEDYKGWVITRKGGPRRVQISKHGEAHIFAHHPQARAWIDAREKDEPDAAKS